MGEALGGGDRGTHRWRGGARQSRKRRLSARKGRDGGCSGVRSGGQHVIDRSGWRRRGCEGGRCGVERAGGRRGVELAGGGGLGRQALRVGSGERCGVGWSGGQAGRAGTRG
jgi:hypothetical protein